MKIEFSKKINEKLTMSEIKEYKKLLKDYITSGEKMEKYQRDAAIYSRKLRKKIKNPTKKMLNKEIKLNNKGYKYEYYAFKKAGKLFSFINKMKKKYGK
jgi:outer membrane receptor for monomeric catechols